MRNGGSYSSAGKLICPTVFQKIFAARACKQRKTASVVPLVMSTYKEKMNENLQRAFDGIDLVARDKRIYGFIKVDLGFGTRRS